MDAATSRPPSERNKQRRSVREASTGATASNTVAHGRYGVRSSRRVRVAFCIDGMGIGGTELNALRTAERLDPSRFDVSVVCLQDHGPLLDRYRERGISVLPLPLGRLHGMRAVRQGVRLARYLAEQNVDIVHSHDAYNNIFSTVWARMACTPVVIASRRWCDDLPRKALVVVNRFGFRLAHCVIANSTQVAELLVKDDGVPAERVAVVPNFVDETAFIPLSNGRRQQLVAALDLSPASHVIGCVAGLRPVKDHETLIRAIASLRSRWPLLRLVLIGDGPSRAQLEQLVRQLNLTDTVRFAGALLDEQNLHDLFDVSVLSSLSEGLPNTLVEAMAAGKPVVATRVGGVTDAVCDGETGTLVPQRSPTDFARALEPLLVDPGLRHAMGEAGRRRARERFHVSSVLSTLESLYARLLRSRAR